MKGTVDSGDMSRVGSVCRPMITLLWNAVFRSCGELMIVKVNLNFEIAVHSSPLFFYTAWLLAFIRHSIYMCISLLIHPPNTSISAITLPACLYFYLYFYPYLSTCLPAHSELTQHHRVNAIIMRFAEINLQFCLNNVEVFLDKAMQRLSTWMDQPNTDQLAEQNVMQRLLPVGRQNWKEANPDFSFKHSPWQNILTLDRSICK